MSLKGKERCCVKVNIVRYPESRLAWAGLVNNNHEVSKCSQQIQSVNICTALGQIVAIGGAGMPYVDASGFRRREYDA